MSITNIEINFAANGSSHSATITEIVGGVSCGDKSVEMISSSKIGKASQVNNSEINELLKNFLLESKTTSKDPRTTKVEYKYIDRVSELLERYVVLVRGITAPAITRQFSGQDSFLNESADPNGKLKFSGPVYACSELPQRAFGPREEYVPTSMLETDGRYMENNVYKDESRNLLIIGASYSVVSQDIRNQKSFQVYNGRSNQKIDVLSLDSEFTKRVPVKTPLGRTASIDPTQSQQIDATKATLRYGYTAKEFFFALEAVGVEFEENPLTDKGDNLFETSGNLRDCLSDIASYYGFYWYVNLGSDGGVIKFISSKEASELEITDPLKLTDENITSCSFTEGGRSPFTVASYMGTTAPYTEGWSHDATSRIRQLAFSRVDMHKFFPSEGQAADFIKVAQLFYPFFCSGATLSDQSFDKYFLMAMHLSDETIFPSLGSLYPATLAERGQVKRYEELVNSSSLNAKLNETFKPYIDLRNTLYYSFQSTESKAMPFPSDTPIYKALEDYYSLFGTLYISNGVSGTFKDRHDSTGGQISVIGPFPATQKLKDTEELSAFYDLARVFDPAGADAITILGIANHADIAVGIGEPSEKYFYFARAPLKPVKKVVAEENLYEECILDFNVANSTGSTNKIAINERLKENIKNAFKGSALQFQQAVKRLKDSYRITFSRIEVGQDGTSGEGEKENFPIEFVYQKVKSFGRQKFCKTELKNFSGSIQDIQILANAEDEELGVVQNDLLSSTISYAGLQIPDTIDITLDSISLSFSESGITTTVSKSNKNLIPLDQNLVINKAKASSTFNYRQGFSAGAKNFFKIH